MENAVYYIWFLLPGILIYVGISAYVKPYISKRAGREDVKALLTQAGYTSIIFFVAVLLDCFFLADLIHSYVVDPIVFEMVRFFIYPLCLVIAVEAQRIIKKEDAELAKSEFKPRMRY